MDWRARGAFIGVVLVGCGDDRVLTTTEDPGSTATSMMMTSTTEVEPTVDGPTGAGATSTGSEEETGGTTEGPVVPTGGAARVLYFASPQNGQATPGWFAVDCSGPTPGPPTQVNEALAPGASIVQEQVPIRSLSRRWLGYQVAQADSGRELWFVRIGGAAIGAASRVELPPQVDFTRPVFSLDEQRVAFGVLDEEERGSLFLCSLTEDGGCAPTLWSPPLPGADIDARQVVFSADGGRIAYAGDLEGSGVRQMFVAGTSPDDAGKSTQVSQIAMGYGALVGWFALDGLTLYFEATSGELQSSPDDLFAVDVAADPPGPPILVSPPLLGVEPRIYRPRRDVKMVLMWSGGTDAISSFALGGVMAAAPVRLSGEDQRVRFRDHNWVGDEARVFYVASTSDPEQEDLFVVDAAMEPPTPVRINLPIDVGEGVDEVKLSDDASRLFYTVRVGENNEETLWMAMISPLSPPVELSAPLAPSGYLPLDLAIAADLSRVAYESQPVSSGHGDRLLVELAGPSAPVVLPRPTGGSWGYGDEFSADGRRLFFTTDANGVTQNGGGVAFQIDVVPSPAQPVQISDEAHDARTPIVLPAG